MISYYRVEFQLNGKKKYEIQFGYNAQYAVDEIKRDYEPMGEVKIDHVWKDGGSVWETTEDWD